MNKDFHDKKLKSFKTMTERWVGVSAKIWEFQTSHSKLVLRIDEKDRKGNLHIICLGPIFLHGPIKWDANKIKLDFYDDEKGIFYKVSDESVDFYVICEAIEIKENCAPIY